MKDDFKQKSPRRAFLGTLAAGAATIGAASLAPLHAKAMEIPGIYENNDPDSPDQLFNNIKGKHRIV